MARATMPSVRTTPKAATQAWSRAVALKFPGAQAWTTDTKAPASATYTTALTSVAITGAPDAESPSCLTVSGTSMATVSAAVAMIAPSADMAQFKKFQELRKLLEEGQGLQIVTLQELREAIGYRKLGPLC